MGGKGEGTGNGVPPVHPMIDSQFYIIDSLSLDVSFE